MRIDYLFLVGAAVLLAACDAAKVRVDSALDTASSPDAASAITPTPRRATPTPRGQWMWKDKKSPFSDSHLAPPGGGPSPGHQKR